MTTTTATQTSSLQKTVSQSSDSSAPGDNLSKYSGPSAGAVMSGSFFPLGYRDAISQWWMSGNGSISERAVFNLVPHLKESAASSAAKASTTPSAQAASTVSEKSDPYGPREWQSSRVTLSGHNRSINEYSVTRTGEQTDETLVMLHGYGAGLGFFYRNFEPLSRVRGLKLYALDLLGMGNSSRPSFKITAKDKDGKIAEAENFFVDSLEEWRVHRKVDKFTLFAHSLGGYLAVSYALKYPGHINKLILVSPVGVPENPYAVREDLPDPATSNAANEFTQSQDEIVNNAKSPLDPKTGKPTGKAGPPPRVMSPWVRWLWDTNAVSPFSIVRAVGPLGPRFVSGWTSRRFNHLPEGHSQVLHTYSYDIFRQRGSGEFALTYILAAGAHARNPIINRIQNVGRQPISAPAPLAAAEPNAPIPSEQRENGYPIVMMYGAEDWMDVKGGYAAEKKINARTKEVRAANTPEQNKLENGSAKVVVIQRAGHHLYLDNADDFNAVVTKELEETRDYVKKMKA